MIVVLQRSSPPLQIMDLAKGAIFQLRYTWLAFFIFLLSIQPIYIDLIDEIYYSIDEPNKSIFFYGF